MKKDGSITIYLSLILMSLIMLINVLTEAARLNAVQTKSRAYTYMAADSVLAGYAKQIYRDYGVLLVWTKETVDKQIEKYIQDNIKGADLKGTGSNFMSTELVHVSVEESKNITEAGGKDFVKQIVSYMKYAGGIKTAKSLIEEVEEYSQNNMAEKPNKSDVAHMIETESEEFQEIVKDINREITNLTDIKTLQNKTNAVSQKFEKVENTIEHNNDKNVRKFLSAYRKLTVELDKKAGEIDSAIILIKQYEEKKERFLKKSGYTSDAKDYIDEDLKNLEKAENTIKENKELGVSNFSEIDSKNIDTVNASIKKIESIQIYLKSLTTASDAETDKENQSIYENAKAFLNSGILSLVLENVSDISDNAVSDTNLPSNFKTEQIKNSIFETTVDKALLCVYADMKFGNFLHPGENSGLKYELEYIIGGNDNDKDNLTDTVEKIITIRNVMNLAYLANDTEKMSEISTVSSSTATAFGIPFLEPIIKGVLAEAWALAEAVSDVRALYKGEKIALIKSSDNWKTSLKNLARNKENEIIEKKGIDYATYLQMIIFSEKEKNCIYRIMDLIQINVQTRYNRDFLMVNCIQEMDITAYFKIKQIFTAVPWIVKGLSEDSSAYEYNVKCKRGY